MFLADFKVACQQVASNVSSSNLLFGNLPLTRKPTAKYVKIMSKIRICAKEEQD